MYQKILVAEDLKSINEGVQHLLEEIEIPVISSVQYCDDALLKLKKAVIDNEPYELLITDLSFKKDHRNEKYSSGEELIAVVKDQFPDIHIIVYSVDDRIQKIKKLFEKFDINGFVCKGRNGIQDLKDAIFITYKNKVFISSQVSQALRKTSSINIDDYDIILLNYLAQGHIQDEISQLLKNQKISPNSLSTVEKRINKMKSILEVQNTVHLIAIAKDMGLI
ncbi:hypothetical protein NBRC110019_26580 [Neptunitalea chrysea]|uniref:Response regulatory domain-containing protein n=1 Tax=Neptunitalea chrysea TaxID=1647581 RepID=A0A9W6EWA6_9FLAO|nr:response regulator [Neptunitalea chrysea]GLB53617.1 hypothetical protein NBRC110019_26580 [Neptunitalea chrysea]